MDVEEKISVGGKRINAQNRRGLFNKISVSALLTVISILGVDIIFKPREPHVFNSQGKVNIQEPLLSLGHWDYSAYENGGEYFSRMYNKYGATFDDENGDGVFEEIAIMANYYRDKFGALRVYLTDPNDNDHKRWSKIGWEEIEKKRSKYKKYIPFKKVLEKIIE